MATNIDFRHFESGVTLTLELRAYGTGDHALVNPTSTATAVIDAVDDPRRYRCEISEDVAAGWYVAEWFEDGDLVGAGSVYVSAANTGTYEVGSVPAAVEQVQNGLSTFDHANDKVDLVDAPNAAAVTALQNGVSTFDPAIDTVARVTLVDTCTANTDMRGTDGAVTSLSGVASSTDVSDAAQAVISAIPDVSDLALEATALEVKTQTDKLDFTGAGNTLKSESTNMRGTDDATKVSDLSALALEATSQSIKTKTDAIPSAIDNATAVWSASTRTLSSFGTLVSDIATAVWGATTRTLSGFSHKVTVEANEDKTGYSLQTSPPTKEDIAGQVRTELATELGRIDAAVSSRLAPTTAGRTLNVEEDGTILTTAEVSEESIRNAVGLEDGKRVATPEDVNITIGSVQATVNDRGEGFQIRQFVGEVFPCVVLGVTDGAGPVDLSGYEDLRLILQDRCGADVQVVEHDAITVFGDDSNSFSWTPSADLVSKARRIEGALWEYKDGERFKVIITGSITIEDCPRKDEA